MSKLRGVEARIIYCLVCQNIKPVFSFYPTEVECGSGRDVTSPVCSLSLRALSIRYMDNAASG